MKYFVVTNNVLKQVKLAEFLESLASAANETAEAQSISLEETNAEDQTLPSA